MKKIMSKLNTRALSAGAASTALVGVGMSVAPVYAAPSGSGGISDIGVWVNSTLKDVYGVVRNMAVPAAITVLAVVFILKIFVRDERQAATLDMWMKRVIFALVGILSLGFLAKVIESTTSGQEFNAWK